MQYFMALTLLLLTAACESDLSNLEQSETVNNRSPFEKKGALITEVETLEKNKKTINIEESEQQIAELKPIIIRD